MFPSQAARLLLLRIMVALATVVFALTIWCKIASDGTAEVAGAAEGWGLGSTSGAPFFPASAVAFRLAPATLTIAYALSILALEQSLKIAGPFRVWSETVVSLAGCILWITPFISLINKGEAPNSILTGVFAIILGLSGLLCLGNLIWFVSMAVSAWRTAKKGHKGVWKMPIEEFFKKCQAAPLDVEQTPAPQRADSSSGSSGQDERAAFLSGATMGEPVTNTGTSAI